MHSHACGGLAQSCLWGFIHLHSIACGGLVSHFMPLLYPDRFVMSDGHICNIVLDKYNTETQVWIIMMVCVFYHMDTLILCK